MFEQPLRVLRKLFTLRAVESESVVTLRNSRDVVGAERPRDAAAAGL
jgi:hypothetical protein